MSEHRASGLPPYLGFILFSIGMLLNIIVVLAFSHPILYVSIAILTLSSTPWFAFPNDQTALEMPILQRWYGRVMFTTFAAATGLAALVRLVGVVE